MTELNLEGALREIDAEDEAWGLRFKEKLSKVFRALCSEPKPKPERTYHVGQRFRLITDKKIYLLSQVSMQGEAALISMVDGNIWRRQVKVKHCAMIAQDEFDRITGLEWQFEPVEE